MILPILPLRRWRACSVLCHLVLYFKHLSSWDDYSRPILRKGVKEVVLSPGLHSPCTSHGWWVQVPFSSGENFGLQGCTLSAEGLTLSSKHTLSESPWVKVCILAKMRIPGLTQTHWRILGDKVWGLLIGLSMTAVCLITYIRDFFLVEGTVLNYRNLRIYDQFVESVGGCRWMGGHFENQGSYL